jgi:hypothetical protein
VSNQPVASLVTATGVDSSFGPWIGVDKDLYYDCDTLVIEGQKTEVLSVDIANSRLYLKTAIHGCSIGSEIRVAVLSIPETDPQKYSRVLTVRLAQIHGLVCPGYGMENKLYEQADKALSDLPTDPRTIGHIVA